MFEDERGELEDFLRSRPLEALEAVLDLFGVDHQRVDGRLLAMPTRYPGDAPTNFEQGWQDQAQFLERHFARVGWKSLLAGILAPGLSHQDLCDQGGQPLPLWPMFTRLEDRERHFPTELCSVRELPAEEEGLLLPSATIPTTIIDPELAGLVKVLNRVGVLTVIACVGNSHAKARQPWISIVPECRSWCDLVLTLSGLSQVLKLKPRGPLGGRAPTTALRRPPSPKMTFRVPFGSSDLSVTALMAQRRLVAAESEILEHRQRLREQRLEGKKLDHCIRETLSSMGRHVVS